MIRSWTLFRVGKKLECTGVPSSKCWRGWVTNAFILVEGRAFFSSQRCPSWCSTWVRVQSECYQIWVTILGQGRDVKLQRSSRSHDRKYVKMADLVNFFKNLLFQIHQSEHYQIWVSTLGQGRDGKLLKSCGSRDRKCVKMADFINIWENHINSFKNLLLQNNQSECYRIWVATFRIASW